MSVDLEDSTAFHKVESLAEGKAAAMAGENAIKARPKAKQAEASAAEARKILNNSGDTDTMITIVKSVIGGKPRTFASGIRYTELRKRADALR
jgi:hypothetical protein